MVAHIYSVGFIAAMAYFSQPGSTFFSWHPFLMTIGYVGFMFQAILVFSNESSLFGSWDHRLKVRAHWVLNSLGLASIFVAASVIYFNKEELNRAHLTSWHGLIGFVTIVYTCGQFVAGFGLTVFQFLTRKVVPYSRLKMYHATSGTFLYVLACISMGMGIHKYWYADTDTPFYIWYLSFAFTGLLGMIVTNQVTARYVKPHLLRQQQQKKKVNSIQVPKKSAAKKID